MIEGDDPNAFALPGGYVFVNTGLIQMAEEEDEFAGALAHEIAHVAARHMTRRETKAEIANHRHHSAECGAGRMGGVAAARRPACRCP